MQSLALYCLCRGHVTGPKRHCTAAAAGGQDRGGGGGGGGGKGGSQLIFAYIGDKTIYCLAKEGVDDCR